MINNIKTDLAKVQKENDQKEKVKQLKLLKNRLLKIIVSPNYSQSEKEEAESLIRNLVFSSN
jgi:hypothetical protein